MAAQPARPKVVTQDGEPAVHLDLDAVEHEATDVDFTFRVGGQIFRAKSPEDADWQAFADVDQPGGLRALILELLGPDDYERFCDVTVSQKQLNAVIDGARKHYGVSPGESQASSRSSSSSRRR